MIHTENIFMMVPVSSLVRLSLGKFRNGNRKKTCIGKQLLTYLTLNAELNKLIFPKQTFLPLMHPSIEKYCISS